MEVSIMTLLGKKAYAGYNFEILELILMNLKYVSDI